MVLTKGRGRRYTECPAGLNRSEKPVAEIIVFSPAMKNPWKLTALLLAAVLALGLGSNFLASAHAAATPTRSKSPAVSAPSVSATPVEKGGAPEAEAGDQKHMENALASLRSAFAELQAAHANKGGYRVLAMGNVKEAIANTQTGIAFREGKVTEKAPTAPKPAVTRKVESDNPTSNDSLAQMYQKLRSRVQNSN
jgi:hypothetical protein